MRAKKSLGQHFLKCRWVIDALIKAAEIRPTETILEIGPGNGVLTRELAKYAQKVVAVEKDEGLAERLRSELKNEGVRNVEIVEGDILKTFSEITKSYKLKAKGYKVAANIPYYLTSRLFRTIFSEKILPERVVLTIQKEVAQRIAARPPKMNQLALSVQVFGKPTLIKNIPPGCFSPKPKVDSAIIKITEISRGFFTKHHLSEDAFFKVIRSAFSHKRKVLSNNLTKYASKAAVGGALNELGLSPLARAEEVKLAQWPKIILAIKKP